MIHRRCLGVLVCPARVSMSLPHSSGEITYLRAIQPVDIPQSPPNLGLLLLSTGLLLLFLSLELHVIFAAFSITHDRRASSARGRRTDIRACHTASRARVFKAVHADCEVALVSNAAVGNMPLLWAESAHEFFVMGNHDDTSFEVADSNSETTEGVTVQEISGFVEN